MSPSKDDGSYIFFAKLSLAFWYTFSPPYKACISKNLIIIALSRIIPTLIVSSCSSNTLSDFKKQRLDLSLSFNMSYIHPSS